ncbi:hypothetical protein FVA74_07360 [Salinibacterium sp. dk2585]|uniref:aminotransferase class IV n=1 Tax=unclassified Salinibacterium TaxID=2632331 RepID=UPI0011C255BD|nr:MULTISPECIES: aminotransferase class IV [unclassified Salinibacterium]QEE61413.1 hypothetical protein FVA74_07360 [Salinibacterium sp. dk2585]TXK54090.1 aminotransferase class IV [Salinibacterium sp. dk5596]
MSAHAILRWTGTGLDAALQGEADDGDILVADSWLVTHGAALAIALHRDRFLATASELVKDAEAFWDAVIATIPRTGEWFPRVELRRTGRRVEAFLRVRPAPERRLSTTLLTHEGEDPRDRPRIKGPSLAALETLRAQARDRGADDVVIVDPLGHVAETASSALAWWRGDILCLPAQELDRVDSVTARALLALATATGTQLSWETTTPEELDGLEVWTLNALHGVRIATNWVDGPATAEKPGRLGEWRARLETLCRPLPQMTVTPA